MPAAEFSGNYTHNIDPKGRVTIPAAYREALGDGFTIGLNNQFNAIALYPVEKWQQMSERLDRIPDSDARGIITGLTRGASRKHIIRAALEAIAYQTCDVLDAMEKDVGTLKTIKADGGASSNDFLMQFQADVLARTVVRPYNVESTATGAFMLAGLGCGYYKDISEITRLGGKFEIFTPSMEESRRKELLNGWAKAVERARSVK